MGTMDRFPSVFIRVHLWFRTTLRKGNSMMLKTWMVTAAAVVALGAATAGAAEDPAARDLVKKTLDSVPKKSLQATGTLSSNRGWTREMRLYRKDIGGVDAVFMDVTSPQDVAGTRFLMKDRVEGT